MIVCGMPPIKGQTPSVPEGVKQRFMRFFTTHTNELLGSIQRHKVAAVAITAAIALVAVFAYRFFTRREEKPASQTIAGELRYEIVRGKFFVSCAGKLGDFSQFQRIRKEKIAVIPSREVNKQTNWEELYSKHFHSCARNGAHAVQLPLLYGEASKAALFAAAEKALRTTGLIEIQLVDEKMVHSFEGLR